MGNSLGCSASGERLVSAARDGDLIEARMLLEFNPSLAKYSTFGGLNSPLHFAAAKGHNEFVTLLLENGADVNSRNYCGQTALMQACRYGHWEVVQTLLLYRCNVTRADYLNGRTALHFAAVAGHARCIRLVVADFVPSAPLGSITPGQGALSGNDISSSPLRKYDHNALTKFICKPADGGVTALHMAALNGRFDCVQLLLDLNASVSAVTFHYGSSVNLIGPGSTPLHYAACGGNIKCCQVLISKGASRLTLNCNGWLPVDIARVWGHHWLEPLLKPNSELAVPSFPLSNYMSLPLMSILNIARDCGLQSSTALSDDNDVCAVCLERACNVAAEGCGHQLCTKCALCLCSSATNSFAPEMDGAPGSISCPLCRHGIVSFVKLPNVPAKGVKLKLALSLCSPCMVHSRDLDPPIVSHRSDPDEDHSFLPSDIMCPVSCSPFPSVSIPSCSCDDDACTSIESEDEMQRHSPRTSRSSPSVQSKSEEQSLVKTSCSKMFWNRRSYQREQQCNSEINI